MHSLSCSQRILRHAAIVAVFLLPACFSPRAGAAFTPARYEARQTPTPPTVDGDLSDPCWSSAELIGPFFAYQSGGAPAASQTTMRLLWDDQYLYVAFQAADEDVRSSCALVGACGHDAALFQGDVVELFLRESTAQVRYHEFEWSPSGADFDARFETRFGAPGKTWESGLSSAVAVDGSLDVAAAADVDWTAEARIPLAAFESAVAVGTTWTFTGARYDYFNPASPGGPALMMSTRGDPEAPAGGVTNGFHTYEIYDTLEFVGEPVPEPSSLGAAAVMAAIAAASRRRRA